MHVLIAFDKFKDALSATEANRIAQAVLAESHPDWTTECCALADGGEGFASTVTTALGGREVSVKVSDPLGRPRSALIGWIEASRVPPAMRARLEPLGLPPGRPLAVLEMASASGLALLAAGERDPWRTSTRGTGELIRAASVLGAGGVVLGVGGSATHDLGLGALGALGYEFLDPRGRRIDPPVPARWEELEQIRPGKKTPLPPVVVATDVRNPLLGPDGAAARYAPQKGLRAGDVAHLDELSVRVARLLCDSADQPEDVVREPGMGAAGGLAFGLRIGLEARCTPGFDLVYDALGLEERLGRADLVLTGEGRVDATSWSGKGPMALAGRARARGKRVHLFAGAVEGVRVEPDLALTTITPPDSPLAEALSSAPHRLAEAIRRL